VRREIVASSDEPEDRADGDERAAARLDQARDCEPGKQVDGAQVRSEHRVPRLLCAVDDGAVTKAPSGDAVRRDDGIESAVPIDGRVDRRARRRRVREVGLDVASRTSIGPDDDVPGLAEGVHRRLPDRAGRPGHQRDVRHAAIMRGR
jgi:hypothetical protein